MRDVHGGEVGRHRGQQPAGLAESIGGFTEPAGGQGVVAALGGLLGALQGLRRELGRQLAGVEGGAFGAVFRLQSADLIGGRGGGVLSFTVAHSQPPGDAQRGQHAGQPPQTTEAARLLR